jgi:hypothetical protein
MQIKQIYCLPNQTLLDIAVQEYGGVEGVFLLMLANRDKVMSITQILVPGDSLFVWPLKIVERVASTNPELTSSLPFIIQLISLTGSVTQSSSATTLSDADYVHIGGNELVDGIKTFLDELRTDAIADASGVGIVIEGLMINDGVVDLGYF